MKLLNRLALSVAVLAVATAGASWALQAYADRAQPRGRMVPVGEGRVLRLVCAGPSTSQPAIWLEAGAFSGAADFGAIQQKLAALGYRSCAYDRAGLGFSPPAPGTRDAVAIARDLDALFRAVGETGPVVLVGHSMGGLYVRRFALEHPDRVAGVVLVEAATPEMLGQPGAAPFIAAFRNLSRTAAAAGRLGLARFSFLRPDRIGLPPAAAAEKRRGLMTRGQTDSANREVAAWRAAARQAAERPLDPAWPVAVVTAGGRRPADWEAARRRPALASRSGSFRNVSEASHTSVLGETHGEAVIEAILHVLRAG
jgi:pimeloyl-ACP methyl ester carboxylesterase